MKSRRKHGFQFMTILYFLIVFCMCVSRFNVIMTIMGGQLTRVEEINLLPFHSVRENLQYGRNPISWDMLYNMVMFVPFGIIYCYYQKHFRVYKAVGMSCLTTFFIESAQFILKTGVVDESDVAWTNGNWEANCRAVTIETSNGGGAPEWPVSDTTFQTLVTLVADIARRNGLGKLVKGKNLTWHSMYAATACPGPYLSGKLQELVDKANTINGF